MLGHWFIPLFGGPPPPPPDYTLSPREVLRARSPFAPALVVKAPFAPALVAQSPLELEPPP